MDSITTTVELTLQDIQRVTSMAYTKTPMVYALGLLMIANVIILILIIAIGLVWDRRAFSDSLPLYPFLAAGIGIPAAILCHAYFSKAEKIWNENSHLKNPITYIITSDDLCIKSSRATKTLNWVQFSSFEEDNRSFYLYLPTNQFIILPKQYLNENKESEIQSLLYTKLKQVKRTGTTIGAVAIIILLLPMYALLILTSTVYLIQGGLR